MRTLAEIREGKNTFMSEATVSGGAPDWIRSGMQGTVRIDVGRHPICSEPETLGISLLRRGARLVNQIRQAAN